MTKQVYFVAHGHRIKIGTTANLKQRLRDISAHLVGELVLIAAIDGGRDVEAAIHKLLKPHRLKGEWFSDCPEVRSLIASLQATGLEAIAGTYVPKQDHTPVGPKIEPDPILRGLVRLRQLWEHPILVQFLSLIEAAKRANIDPVPACIPIMDQIPHEDKLQRWINAHKALAAADGMLKTVGLSHTDIFLPQLNVSVSPDDDEAVDRLVTMTLDQTERTVIESFGPYTH